VAALAAGGGYWYVRNILRVGSPLPAIELPGLPSPRLPAVEAYGFSVAHYIGEGYFWREVVPDGFRLAFGPVYPLVLLLAAAGVVASLVATRGDGDGPRAIRRTLLAAVVVGGAVYVVTPVTAYGPSGNPFLFGANLRYLFPALHGGLLLLALAAVGRSQRLHMGLLAIAGATILAELGRGLNDGPSPLRDHGRWIAAAVVVWAAGLVAWRALMPDGQLAHRHRAALAVAALLLLAAGAAAGHRVSDRYIERRYAGDPIFAWAREVRDARIAVVGFPTQYPLVGLDLSNRVEYLGRQGRDGAFDTYDSCAEVRDALRRGRYDWFVAGSNKWGLEPIQERAWEQADPAATLELESAGDAVFRLQPTAATTTEGC
jgi:hypothetical protein